jgi:hypothetical protein
MDIGSVMIRCDLQSCFAIAPSRGGHRSDSRLSGSQLLSLNHVPDWELRLAAQCAEATMLLNYSDPFGALSSYGIGSTRALVAPRCVGSSYFSTYRCL